MISKEVLLKSEIEVVGKISSASNATFLVKLLDGSQAVYKPVKGERPLWDFEGRSLGRREMAAFVFLENVDIPVPTTVWRDDLSFGPGILQSWIEIDEVLAVNIVKVSDVYPKPWINSIVGHDANDQEVALIHRDDSSLRKIALVDLVMNNADRKASHLLHSNEVWFPIDHGLTWHVDFKLRTVLWGWGDLEFDPEEQKFLKRSFSVVAKDSLLDWISIEERDAALDRIETLLESNHWPSPAPSAHVLPWPIY